MFEVNLSKPLLAMFSIKYMDYKIEYEGLQMLCLVCERFGHYKEGCLVNNKGKGVAVEQGIVLGQREGQSMEDNHLGGGDKGEGPWQVMQKLRRGRRGTKK